MYKTSDSFQIIYDSAVELIKSGDAYVDSLSAEEMREYRGSLTEPGKNSPYRNRSVEENLKLIEMVRNEYGFNSNSLFCLRLFLDLDTDIDLVSMHTINMSNCMYSY